MVGKLYIVVGIMIIMAKKISGLEKKCRDLTWKNFWQQKWIEFGAVFLIITVPALIGGLLYSLWSQGYSWILIFLNITPKIFFWNLWQVGIGILSTLAIPLIVIGAIIWGNWIWAKERAEETVY